MQPSGEKKARSGFGALARTWGVRLIGPALLIYLVVRADFGRILAELGQARPLPLIIALLVLTWPPILARWWRWRVLNRALGVRIAPGREWLTHLAAAALGLVTPGRAGEFVKLHLLERLGVPTSRSFASVVGDRLADAVWLLTAGAAALAWHLARIGRDAAWVWWGLGALIMAGAAGGWLALGLARRLKTRLHGRLAPDSRRGKLLGWLGEAWSGFSALGWRAWTAAGVLTVLAWLLQMLQGWVFLQALGLAIGPLDLVAALTLAALLALLPVSVAGIGSRDLALVYFFGLAGVAPSGALAYSFCIILTVLVCLAGGALAAWRLPSRD
ncbi:MAG: lysylphosphatidylglycerol synthase transmembrane domain-containing protein [Pseudomonadota bacterium]